MALEAIEEAPRGVTLLIATPVLKEIPAGNTGGAVQPRPLPIQRAVSSVPLAFVVVALLITHGVPRLALAVQVRAGAGPRLLAVPAREVKGAAAAVLERVGRVSDAGSPVLAGQRAPLTALTVRTAEALLALAVRLAHRWLHTAPSVLAVELSTGVAFTTAEASEALRRHSRCY